MYLVTTNGIKNDPETLENSENSDPNFENIQESEANCEEMNVKNRKINKNSEKVNGDAQTNKKSDKISKNNANNGKLHQYQEISRFKKVFHQICDIFDMKFLQNSNPNICVANNFRNFKKLANSDVKNDQNKSKSAVVAHSKNPEVNPQNTSTKPPQKSKLWAYIWWLFGGIFGLHLFYLERDAHAFLTWSTFGGYGVGWLADIVRIPRYVREYNEEPVQLQALFDRMRKNRKPVFSTSRFISAIMVGYLWGQMVMLAIPSEEVRGINLNAYLHWFIPLASALGVWIVGNIGKEQGKPWLTILVSYMTYSSRWYFFDESIWLSIMVFSAALAFDTFSKEWKFKKQKKKSLIKRIAVLGICATLYLSVWSSYLYFNGKVTDSNGDEIPLHEALHHFFTSPWWTDLKQSLWETYQYAQHHGWYEIWKQIIDLSDPQGEQNAYKVLGVSPTSSQSEITSSWRKLSREFHPDKVKDPSLQRAAQEKFMEIQQAYDILSNIKNKRRRKNKKSVERGEEHEL